MNVHRLIAPSRAAPRTCGKAQRGMVLFIVLIILVVMTLSGVALVRSVDTTSVIAGNMAFKQGALTATDVGIEAASQKLLLVAVPTANDATNNYSASYNPALAVPAGLTAATGSAIVDASGTGNTVRYWVERMCIAAGAVTPVNCVREQDRDSPYFRVTIRAEGPRGTLAITQSTVQLPAQFSPAQAIVTEWLLRISGNINLGAGGAGSAHSNTRLETSGTTTMSGGASAVGPASGGGGSTGVYSSGTFTGGITNDAAAINIPEFNPTDYAAHADFRLRKDGSVTNRLGTILMTAAQGQGGTQWLGWKCSSNCSAGTPADLDSPVTAGRIAAMATWELKDDISWSSGMLYVEGHVKIPSAPGKPGNSVDKGPSPWIISILATGHIDVSGEAYVQNYMDDELRRYATKSEPVPNQEPPQNPYTNFLSSPPWPSAPVAVQNLFLVAGTDLKIGGNMSQSGAEGLFTAREQLEISGNPSLRGAMLIKNKHNVDSLISNNYNYISGNMSLQYSGNLTTPAVLGIARRVSWRTPPSL